MKKFLSLVLTLFLSGFIYAAPPQKSNNNMPQEPSHKHQQNMKQNFDRLIKELNISEEQQEKIKEMMQTDISRKKELRQQIKEKSDSIDEELLKENIDMNVVNKLAQEIQQLSAEISKINIESKLKVRSTLTFDQYSKMEQTRKSQMMNNKNHEKMPVVDKTKTPNKKDQKSKK